MNFVCCISIRVQKDFETFDARPGSGRHKKRWINRDDLRLVQGRAADVDRERVARKRFSDCCD